jgi:hypothetical protein
MATLEEMFAAYLQREEAKDAAAQKAASDAEKQEREAQFVTKADLEGAFASFGEQIATKLGEEIAKALPVGRAEGAGRVGEEKPAEESEFEQNPVAYVAKKAAADRTKEEKQFIWKLTRDQLMF